MLGTRALEMYVELHKICHNFSQPFSNLVIGVFMVNEIAHATPIYKTLAFRCKQQMCSFQRIDKCTVRHCVATSSVICVCVIFSV